MATESLTPALTLPRSPAEYAAVRERAAAGDRAAIMTLRMLGKDKCALDRCGIVTSLSRAAQRALLEHWVGYDKAPLTYAAVERELDEMREELAGPSADLAVRLLA